MERFWYLHEWGSNMYSRLRCTRMRKLFLKLYLKFATKADQDRKYRDYSSPSHSLSCIGRIWTFIVSAMFGPSRQEYASFGNINEMENVIAIFVKYQIYIICFESPHDEFRNTFQFQFRQLQAYKRSQFSSKFQFMLCEWNWEYSKKQDLCINHRNIVHISRILQKWCTVLRTIFFQRDLVSRPS